MAWIQYDLSTGFGTATLNRKVDDAALLLLNKAQIECPEEMGDPTQYNVDITQTPPVLILR